jgi:hypothetical protein
MATRSGRKRRSPPGAKRVAKAGRTRRDIPDKATIVSTETFKSPKGRTYTIIETDQMDPYDDRTESRRRKRPKPDC